MFNCPQIKGNVFDPCRRVCGELAACMPQLWCCPAVHTFWGEGTPFSNMCCTNTPSCPVVCLLGSRVKGIAKRTFHEGAGLEVLQTCTTCKAGLHLDTLRSSNPPPMTVHCSACHFASTIKCSVYCAIFSAVFLQQGGMGKVSPWKNCIIFYKINLIWIWRANIQQITLHSVFFTAGRHSDNRFVFIYKSNKKTKQNDNRPFDCRKTQIIKWRRSEFHSAALVSGSWHYSCWLTVILAPVTGTREKSRATVNVMSNTCAFHAMTSQNACSDCLNNGERLGLTCLRRKCRCLSVLADICVAEVGMQMRNRCKCSGWVFSPVGLTHQVWVIYTSSCSGTSSFVKTGY